MGWSGGTYRKGNYGTNGWTGDASLGIGIEAGRHDTQDDDFMNGINACLTKDGSNAATGNLNIGSNKITNVGTGTLRNDAAQVGQVQDSGLVYGATSGGSANAQTLTLSPAITAYVAGQRFSFLAGFTNTAAATLNVNAVGAKNIFNAATGAAIGAGELVVGRLYEVLYDGTQFQLLNDVTPLQNGDYIWLGTTGGTATAQTASATPAITAYKAGQKFRFLPVAASSGQSATQHTLNINGLGAKDITNSDATNLTAGSFVSGAIVEVVYDGTRFKIVNDPSGWQDWTPTVSSPSGSVSGVGITYAHYIKRKQIVTITGYITFTGTSVGGNIEITNPPVNSSITGAGYVITPCFVSYAAVSNYGYIYNNSGTNFGITKDVSASNFGSGSGSVRFVFTYRGV